ncbi:MAG: fasciclin domain-containing protein [Pseudomonadota bacterium]
MIEVETVEGSLLAVDATDGVVLNGAATVVAADVDASNGVIHVIDTVLLPPM